MASSTPNVMPGDSNSARRHQPATRRKGGVYEDAHAPVTRIPGSQCRAFQRFHIPMAPVCHGSAPKTEEAA